MKEIIKITKELHIYIDGKKVSDNGPVANSLRTFYKASIDRNSVEPTAYPDPHGNLLIRLGSEQ